MRGMDTLLIAILSGVAYHTYGRYLGQNIFKLDPEALCPSIELEDGVDFVPTNREVVFGHHFTSIAGTGPIVGLAIAVFWGWLPALLWVAIRSRWSRLAIPLPIVPAPTTPTVLIPATARAHESVRVFPNRERLTGIWIDGIHVGVASSWEC